MAHASCCGSPSQQSRPSTMQVLRNLSIFLADFRVFAASPLVSLFHPRLKQIHAPRHCVLCRLRDKWGRHALSSNLLNGTPNLPLFFPCSRQFCRMTFSLDSTTSSIIILTSPSFTSTRLSASFALRNAGPLSCTWRHTLQIGKYCPGFH